jgi:DNA-binding LacI/PurR family transcriptional regulator
VPTSTVSRIMRGIYRGRRATAELVLQVAKELNYSPNLIARSMRQSSLPVVLVHAHSDPYSAAYLHALSIDLGQAGFSLMIEYDMKVFVQLRQQFRPCASVLLNATVEGQEELLQSPDVIAIHYAIPDNCRLGCYGIKIDFKNAFAALGRRLTEWGHRRFILFQYNHNFDIERERGFVSGVRNTAGTQVRAETLTQPAQVHTLITAAFERGPAPTAIVCAIDGLAADCIFELAHRGLNVPRDVSVTGCDGVLGVPYLTTVRVPHGEISATIRKWVQEEIFPRKSDKKIPSQVVLPCTIWEGRSAGPVKGKGKTMSEE